MKVILNIEYPPGMDMSSKHITVVREFLKGKVEDTKLEKRYNGAWFWTIDNVDNQVYLNSINKIMEYFTDLYNKGFIQWFYIGEYNSGENL